MPKNINSFILPDKVIEKMKGQIEKTRDTKKEHGFWLCSKPDNVIIDRRHCEGSKCDLTIEGVCEEDEQKIGIYHTHPRNESRMSAIDMKVVCEAAKEKNGEIVPISLISCIGSLNNEINCFIKKKVQPEYNKKMALSCVEEAIECHNTMEVPVTNKNKQLNDIGIKLKEEYDFEIKKGPMSKNLRERFKIYLTKLEKYEKVKKKYDRRLDILTDKYFDTIKI